MRTPGEAVDLILAEEGVDQPYNWPKGQSGITIGYGYDLGYEANFETDWAGQLAPDHIARLKQAHGIRARAAAALAPRFADIHISEPSSREVFLTRNLPREEQRVLDAFPGSEDLPPAAFGALVSLVFNRGAGMTDDPARPSEHTRSEMRAIRDLLRIVAAGTTPPDLLQQIAQQIRSMKRLWVGKPDSRGLLTRREHEAQLVESAIAEQVTGHLSQVTSDNV